MSIRMTRISTPLARARADGAPDLGAIYDAIVIGSGYGGAISAQMLTGAGQNVLLLERGHCLQKHALSSVPGVALEEDASFAATSLPTLVSMVEEGLGITLLPDLATDAGLAAGHDLHLSELAGANPRRVVLAWRQSTAHADLFREIAETLRRTRARYLDKRAAS